MPHSRWIAAFTVIVTIVVLVAFGSSPDRKITPDLPVAPRPLAPGMPPAIGAASCAGVTCHGKQPSQGTDSSSIAAIVWLSNDRHSHAYDILLSDTSNRIMLALNPLAPRGAAAADKRCLACHTNPKTVFDCSPEVRVTRSEGVSCDTCHGNPSKWLQEHTTWNRKPANLRAKYEEHGMTWLNEPDQRAQLCVGCHVGAPENEKGVPPRRDVTHEMLAAGHPRLAFELTSYLNAMPHHWTERDRTGKGDKPASAARIWQTGQAANVAAAARLLEDSARRCDWPEFARFSCYACHHELGAGSSRQPQIGGLRAGLLLDSWNFFVPSQELRSEFARVSREPLCKSKAAVATAALENFLVKWRSAKDPNQVLEATLKELMAEEMLPWLHWDDGAQIYLALVAWHDSVGGEPADISSELENLANALQFERSDDFELNSPKGFIATNTKLAPAIRSLRNLLEYWKKEAD
jgi:hypothetical protein